METRHSFHEQIHAVERATLGGIELVALQLTQAFDAVSYQDVELAGLVIGADRQIDRRYIEVQSSVLSLLARQTPVAGDLRLLTAILPIIRCVERMGDQCVNIAKLVPLSGYHTPKDKDLLDTILAMAHIAHRQLLEVFEAFKVRHLSQARKLAADDEQVSTLSRQVFQRSLQIGDEPEIREWAMFMILVARALERVSGNTVDIAEQVVFVITGEFRQLPPDIVG